MLLLAVTAQAEFRDRIRSEYKVTYLEKYKSWIDNTDEDIVNELKLIEDNNEIYDRFYRDLEFGTGGLRGVLGAGTNRMNIYTVRKATQGLANELLDCGEKVYSKGVVIAHDSRNMSREFALECTKVLSANGIKAYLFDSLRPTPMLSFAVRHLGTARGIVITASHNPKEYNGYKVYGEDGGQIPPEVADGILKYIDEIDIFKDVKCGEAGYIEIGKEVDDAYINAVKEQSMQIDMPEDFKVVYTPIHGSGNIPVRRVISEIGVKNLIVVEEQELPDGNFSTVNSPNPENKEALDMSISYAKKYGADLAFGTDPDCDRIGVAVRTTSGEYVCLNGNQTGALLCEFVLRKLSKRGTLPKNAAVIKTIVTTELVRKIAESYGATLFDVLTGFKFIGEKIKEFEENNSYTYIFGLEESYGYLKGTYARDKDAVVAAMLICEMAADYQSRGMTLYDGLLALYQKYGYTEERLVTKTLYGEDGSKHIKEIMEILRNNPPKHIGNSEVVKILDYKQGVDKLPKADVLKFFFKDGWFAARPSGTEPKIKFYYGFADEDEKKVNERLLEIESYIDKIK